MSTLPTFGCALKFFPENLSTIIFAIEVILQRR
jgi:hypothetical protein